MPFPQSKFNAGSSKHELENKRVGLKQTPMQGRLASYPDEFLAILQRK